MKMIVWLFGEDPVEVHRESFERGYPVYSGVLVCPRCATIWAKLTVPDRPFYEARTVPCEQHPEGCHEDLRPVAGSLLDNSTVNGYDRGLLEALPPALVEREFYLHLTSYEAIACQDYPTTSSGDLTSQPMKKEMLEEPGSTTTDQSTSSSIPSSPSEPAPISSLPCSSTTQAGNEISTLVTSPASQNLNQNPRLVVGSQSPPSTTTISPSSNQGQLCYHHNNPFLLE